tara:strand:+ start:1293 stop:1433 length:141 start_codon:yes stop_codon:yes gene_type:complete
MPPAPELAAGKPIEPATDAVADIAAAGSEACEAAEPRKLAAAPVDR